MLFFKEWRPILRASTGVLVAVVVGRGVGRREGEERRVQVSLEAVANLTRPSH